LAEATTSLVAVGHSTSWQVLSDISGRTVIHREVDEDEGSMIMIGPAVRAGIFEHQTDDLERVLGHSSISLRAAVTAVLQAGPS
jgi:hypothetical protein